MYTDTVVMKTFTFHSFAGKLEFRECQIITALPASTYSSTCQILISVAKGKK